MTLINCGSLGGFQAVLLEQESVVKFLCKKNRLLTGPQCTRSEERRVGKE